MEGFLRRSGKIDWDENGFQFDRSRRRSGRSAFFGFGWFAGEIIGFLDEEVQRLPECYRLPLLLARPPVKPRRSRRFVHVLQRVRFGGPPASETDGLPARFSAVFALFSSSIWLSFTRLLIAFSTMMRERRR